MCVGLFVLFTLQKYQKNNANRVSLPKKPLI